MADTPLGKMIIEMGLDDANFSKGITGVNKQLSTLKNDLKTSQSSFNAFGKGVDGVKSPVDVLTKSIQTQQKQLGLLKESYSKSLVDGKASSSTQKYAGDISRANAQLVQMQVQLKAAAEAQYTQTALLPKLSNGLGKVSNGLNTVASKSLPATIAIGAVFAKGVQAAAEFDNKMTEIRALLSDGTSASVLSSQMDTLSKKSKEWAQQYGLDTSSINEGMEEMIKRGYDFNQTVGAMPSVLDASKASGEEFGTVMSASTAILEQFGLKTNDSASMLKNTQRVTDSLTFVANKTSAGFADMGTAMEYVGPVANSLNMSLEETSAAVGLLSNNGIEGEKAGTSLRGALSRLLKPTKQSSAAFKELGINLDDFKKGNLDFPTMLDKIKASTEGMTAAEKSSLISKAFGTEAQTGMNILVAQGGEELRKLTAETKNATGYTKKLADQMNNSDKNAFKKAKASLEVLTIELGQKLLPSIVPVVKEVAGLATSFSNLNPKTQQLIIKMALATAAIGPVSKALSGLSGIASGVTGILGKIGAKGAGKLALRGLATEATAATGAIAGGGGLSTAIGGLSPVLAGLGPVAVGALGVAGLAGLIISVTKEVNKLQDKHNVFGTINVPDETYKQVKDFSNKVTDLKTATEKFGVIGPKAFNDVKTAIKEMGDAANSDIDKATQKLVDDAKVLGWSDKQIDKLKSGGNQAKAAVNASTEEITAIYKNAASQNRKITADEQAKILADQKLIASQELDALKITGDQKAKVMEALSGNMTNISKDTAQQVSNSLQKLMSTETDSYNKQMAAAKELFSSGKMSAQEYNATTKALTEQHKGIMDKYGVDLANAQKKIGEGLKYGTTEYATWYTNNTNLFKMYGISFDEMLAKAGKGTTQLGDTAKLLANYTGKMSTETKKADDTWNGLILDPKTGKITTNASQVVADTLKQKGGWEQIQFVLKHANLTTNARGTILQALISTGQWNNMTPQEKKLVVDNKQGLQAIYDTEGHLAQWNAIPDNVKKLLGDNSSFISNANNASIILTAWNNATPQAKKLLAENLVLQPKMAAQSIIDTLKGKSVPLNANNNTGGAVNSAAQTIASLQGKTVNLNADSSSARTTLDNFLALPASKTINLIANSSKNAQGTPYHQGGLATVNDQRGKFYKELITLPTGESFIPQARDVTMPLPKGTSILKASETAKLIPKYANGTGGIPANSKIFSKMKAVQQNLVIKDSGSSESGQIQEIINVLKVIAESGSNRDVVNALNQFSKRPVYVYLDRRKMTDEISMQQALNQSVQNIINGVI